MRNRTGVLAAIATPAVTMLLGLCGALPASAISKPTFQMPFACGERWEASSRPTHSPSPWAVDWNRDADDLGHIVVATAPGVVTSVTNLGDKSYGLYVVIDHGGGWTTLHAHLLRAYVVLGEHVDQGQVIALLGSSGGATGPHLHYEQRLNRSDRHAAFNGRRLRYDSWLRSRNCGDFPVTGDWNGDRRSDVGVFGRRAVSAAFRERLPDGTAIATSFGAPTDQPVVGDWNGDGQSDLGAFSPSTARFRLQKGSAGRTSFTFGKPGDLPVTGDWDGDGRWDVGVFRPPTHTFYLRDALGNVSSRVFGTVSSLPVVGDWNGDGRFDVGVYDPATSTFVLAMPDNTVLRVKYGTATSLPVTGYWNRDPITDLGVWDRTTGTFLERVRPHKTTTIAFGRRR
ncbi:MAG TPA: VCBS repeat domain-containing M23 family metallopeptidase [Nocardioidaceae bacterium]